DWDVLFLIPSVWASAVLYPVLVSLALFAFGVAILWRSAHDRPLSIKTSDWLGWAAAVVLIIAAFCLGGRHITEDDYRASFSLPLFGVGLGLGLAVCLRTLVRRPRRR
ncbi:MAG: hypothetical protein ACYTAS_14235, partial [Planctomycetota bacterium]